MENAGRDKWLGTLEIISARKPDEAEAEWAWVMRELELGPEFFLAIYEVVKQGRWREAENPGGYLKAAARREARKLTPSGERKPRGARGFRLEADVAEIPVSQMTREGLSREEMLDHLDYRQESGKPIPEEDNVWRSSPGRNDDSEGLLRPINRKPSSYGKGSFKEHAERVMRVRAEQPRDTSNDEYHDDDPPRDLMVSHFGWQKWAEKAGLSGWEKKAIQYKAARVGRKQALAEQPDDESRRALQAAWKKVERTGRLRLEEAAGIEDQGLAADDADETDSR